MSIDRLINSLKPLVKIFFPVKYSIYLLHHADLNSISQLHGEVEAVSQQDAAHQLSSHQLQLPALQDNNEERRQQHTPGEKPVS